MIRVDAQDVPISSLDPSPAQAVRAGQDSAVVQEYLSLIIDRKGWPFPPLEVVETDEGQRLVWDGGHRLAAAQLAAYSVVPVILTRGTAEDALAKARQANVAHGLKRTNADKKKVAEGLVREELERVAGGAKPRSTHELGRLVGLSHAYIGQVRDRLVAESQAATAAVQEVRPPESRPVMEGASVREVIAWKPTPPMAGTPEPAPTSAPSRDMVLERVRVLLDLTLAANGPDAQTVLEEGSVLIPPGQYRQLLVRDVLPRLYEMPPDELTAYLAHLERTAEWMIRERTPPESAPLPADPPKPWIELDDPRLAGHRGVPAADVDAYQSMKAASQATSGPGQFTQERQVFTPPAGALERVGKGLYGVKGGSVEARLAPYADQLGLVDDVEIAGLAGVSVGDVVAARQAKGSAPAAASPVPPARSWPELFQESLLARVEALGPPPEALSVVLSSGWRLTLTPPEEDGAWVPSPKRWADKDFVQAMTPLQGVRSLTEVLAELHNVWAHNRRASGSSQVGHAPVARRSDAYIIKKIQNPAINSDDGRVGLPLIRLGRMIRQASTAKERKGLENDLEIWAHGAWSVADETLLYELPIDTMVTVEGRERTAAFWTKQHAQMAGSARMELMAEVARLHKAWRPDWVTHRGAWNEIDWLAGMPVTGLKVALTPAMQGPEFITAVGVAVGLTWDAWSAATQRRLIHRICQQRRPIGAALPSLAAPVTP